MRSLILTVVLLAVASTAHGQFGMRPVNSAYKNEFGLGLSYGIKLNKDALFVGFAPDYVRVLSEKWLLNVSVAYDEDTEIKDSGRAVTETWTPSMMVGYQATSVLAMGLGVGHGIVENKDGAGWDSVKFGKDLSGALAFAVSLFSKGRHGLSLSLSLEYNFSENVSSISTDLGYGFGF